MKEKNRSTIRNAGYDLKIPMAQNLSSRGRVRNEAQVRGNQTQVANIRTIRKQRRKTKSKSKPH